MVFLLGLKSHGDSSSKKPPSQVEKASEKNNQGTRKPSLFKKGKKPVHRFLTGEKNPKRRGILDSLFNISAKAGTHNPSGLTCFAEEGDKSNPGYVQISKNCDAEDDFCIGFISFARNWCKNDETNILIRYYCDLKKEHLFSSEEVVCETSCEQGICK